MTEEIIIDGVNVAGCRHYDKTLIKEKVFNCYEDNEFPVYCEGNNCLYKQLTRLEQENKELKAYKDVNEDFKKAWDELNEKYTEVLKLAKENADSNEYCLQELEKENKELKKQIESQKGLITVGGKQQYEYLQRIAELEQENKELKKKLELDEVQLESYFIGEEKICKENKKYRSALEEILESAKFSQCLPCGSGNLEDCLNCNDDTTNNGQFCMEKRIHDIKTKCVEVLNVSL